VSSAPRINIELKARDPTPDGSLRVCARLGAEPRGEIWQLDTYFDVPLGRLKLREERPGRSHLIHYVRADAPGERGSRYRIAAVDDSEAMRDLLTACLRVRGVITKRRRLFLWNA
jgi:adenylate cyclase class IV